MRRLALTVDGKIAYCTAYNENTGRGECNHVAHQIGLETSEEFLKRVSSKPGSLKRKLTKESNVILARRMITENVYRSARLEGIETTYFDVEDILNNRGCANLTPNEITTIVNLKRAWEFILDKENLDREIDFAFMQDLHRILGSGLETLNWNEIGRFRTEGILISGTNWRPSTPNPERMWKELNDIKKNPIITERAFDINLWCCKTQAFKDCNKRVSSFLANHELIKNAQGIFSVPDDKCNMYKNLLIKYYESDDSIEIKEFIYNYCYIYDTEWVAFRL